MHNRSMNHILICIFCFAAFTCFGQDKFMEKKGAYYIYKGQFYKTEHLGEVFKIDTEAYALYRSGRFRKKVAKIMTVVGISGVMLGIGTALLGNNEYRSTSQRLIGGGLFLAVVAIILRRTGKMKLKKALDRFNFFIIEKEGYREPQTLSIQLSSKGLGVAYTF